MGHIRSPKTGHLLAAILATITVSASAAETATPCYDVVIGSGTLFDGTGRPGVTADVGVVADRIARIGDLRDACAKSRIDAAGLYVAPGFINIHDHSETEALPVAENMLTQGVTTAVVNADGSGPTDIPAMLAELRSAGLAINAGAAIGFNSVWREVMGNNDRRPAAVDIRRMQDMVVKGLADGAWAVSSGLDYKPGYFATAAEVTAILKPAAKWRTNFPNHDRLTPDTAWSSLTGMRETMTIAIEAGIVPVITHMKVQGNEQGRGQEAVALVDASIASGRYAAADVYPYLAGQTSLGALILPPWALEGGREATKARFRDPALRAKIAAEAEKTMNARWGGAKGVYIIRTGQELTEVMRLYNVPAGEAVIRTLEEGDTGAILRFGVESDLLKILQQPTAAISCDCGASNRKLHPRWAGTFPRVLGHYVRETGALSWQDAIRKMTGLPATIIGMVDRGYLAPGMMADVTIFDPETIIDKASYANPQTLSVGIRHVLVNGKIALAAGRPVGARAGRTLIREAAMPSRKETPFAARSLHFSAQLRPSEGQAAPAGPVQVTVTIAQPGQDRLASGNIRLRGAGGYRIDVTDLGILQTANDWASVSGIGKSADGRVHAVTVIADRANPRAARGDAIFTVDVDGQYRLEGAFRSAAAGLTIKQDSAPR